MLTLRSSSGNDHHGVQIHRSQPFAIQLNLSRHVDTYFGKFESLEQTKSTRDKIDWFVAWYDKYLGLIRVRRHLFRTWAIVSEVLTIMGMKGYES